MRICGAPLVVAIVSVMGGVLASFAGCSTSSIAASLCTSASGSCVDASTVTGLARGHTVPAQYGATCTSGTYFIGPASAWNGACGATIYVVCLGGTWSGAYCGVSLDGGWEQLGPDGGIELPIDAGDAGDASDAADSRKGGDAGRDGSSDVAVVRDAPAIGADAARGADGGRDAVHD